MPCNFQNAVEPLNDTALLTFLVKVLQARDMQSNGISLWRETTFGKTLKVYFKIVAYINLLQPSGTTCFNMRTKILHSAHRMSFTCLVWLSQ
jgi:hypothetical protein